MDILNVIASEISNATGQQFSISSDRRQGGGSINQAIKISGNGLDYFVKLNRPQLEPMFVAESAGLQELGQSGSLSVPKVICSGANEEYAWLVLEYIQLGHGTKQQYAAAGHALADLHGNVHAQFGWHRQNTIGSTRQINEFNDSWYQEHSLILKEIVYDTLNAPLKRKGGVFCLNDLAADQRLAEFGFLMKSQKGSSSLMLDGSEMNLTLEKSGWLKGYIDLVFRIDGRYYLADWKSSNIGAGFPDYRGRSLFSPEII